MRTKTLVIVALAFAAGGTCPSDVNNDGTVGINDFLQVLRDWGPCPNAPRVVDVTEGNSSRLVWRLWSDGTVEALQLDEGCPFEPCPGWDAWYQVTGPSPHASVAQATGIAALSGNSDTSWAVTRVWSDGFTDVLKVLTGPGCGPPEDGPIDACQTGFVPVP